ncbi:MAG: Lnb N-terminal periplasmic domain-containing protein [Nitrospiria bacterium]
MNKGNRFFIQSVSLFFLFLFIFSSLANSETTPELILLLEKADQKKLYSDRYWQILLHYQKTWRDYHSLIDDPGFFLSSAGKEDPKAEMEATIKSFFERNKQGNDHPRCKFIARYEWLKERLELDNSPFADIVCADFNQFEKTIQPKSSALVFPAFYMNNPASMFGHTLLRIDNISQSKLLSFAVNYSAFPDSFGPLYPIKGVFGFYKGFFTVFPYYDTVKKYNDTEQRDMWEYHLNFSEEELKKMVRHLWELKNIYSYYYFFDENCSYNLLYLLEVARPSLHLTDRVRPWVIPTDTLRSIQESGVVENAEFRPAKGTKIRYIASQLNEEAQKKALKIVERKLDPARLQEIDKDEKVKILDLAIEDIQYKYNKHELAKEDYLKVFLSTLNQRSKSGNSRNDADQIPAPAPPEAGHRSSRISFGEGVYKNVAYEEIEYRPAYHSLVDPDDGFAEGLQIVFADTAVRAYNDGRVELENFNLIDIFSLSPRDLFFKPLSYKFYTGWTRQMDPSGDDRLVYRLNPAVGLTFENKWIGLYYGLAEINLNVNSGFKDNAALGGGAEIGIIRKITDSWKINLSVERLDYPLRESFQENKASAVQTLKINQNNSLNFSILWDEVFNNNQTDVTISWNIFF